MMTKTCGITAFSLLLLLSFGFASFTENFQGYNSVTDDAFSLNYSLQSVGVWSITTAPADSLTLKVTGVTGNDTQYVLINQSQVSLNGSFDFSYVMKSGSTHLNGETYYFAFYTNATSGAELGGAHGYYFKYIYDGGLVTLYRSGTGMTIGTGVQLNASTTNVTADFENGDTVFSYSVDNSNVMRFYVNDDLKLSYYDSSQPYSTGGVIFGGGYVPANTEIYYDNLDYSPVFESSAYWSDVSFPDNLEYAIGFAQATNQYSCEGNALTGTTYSINFQPCRLFYSHGAPADTTSLIPAFIMKYNNSLLTPYLIDELSFGDPFYFGFSSDHANTCWMDSGGAIDFPILTDDWTPLILRQYTLFNSQQEQINTNPVLFMGNQIYCTQAENLTAHFYFSAQGVENNEFSFSVPIGYYVYSNGTVDYNIPNNGTFQTTNDFVNTAPPTGNSLIVGFDNLSGLLTPTTVLLCAVLFFGAIVTRDTKSSPIGLIVIMVGALILSFYNFLPWYITVLITIGAGFFIVTEVRKGVFNVNG